MIVSNRHDGSVYTNTAFGPGETRNACRGSSRLWHSQDFVPCSAAGGLHCGSKPRLHNRLFPSALFPSPRAPHPRSRTRIHLHNLDRLQHMSLFLVHLLYLMVGFFEITF